MAVAGGDAAAVEERAGRRGPPRDRGQRTRTRTPGPGPFPHDRGRRRRPPRRGSGEAAAPRTVATSGRPAQPRTEAEAGGKGEFMAEAEGERVGGGAGMFYRVPRQQRPGSTDEEEKRHQTIAVSCGRPRPPAEANSTTSERTPTGAGGGPGLKAVRLKPARRRKPAALAVATYDRSSGMRPSTSARGSGSETADERWWWQVAARRGGRMPRGPSP